MPGESNEFDLIGDDVYSYILNRSSKHNFSNTSWYNKLMENPLVKEV